MSPEPVLLSSLQDAIAVLLKTGDGPAPAGYIEKPQWEMSGAHAVVLRGLYSIYNQASSIPVEKHDHFVGYCLQWIAFIEHHHAWEETSYYPLFGSNFPLLSIVAEHDTFKNGVTEMETYLVSCLPLGTKWGYGKTIVLESGTRPTGMEKSGFDGERLCRIIEGFTDTLIKHLEDEITYLAPEKLRASGLTDADMKRIDATTSKYMASQPPHTFLTYTVTHAPASSGFPPAPGFVKSILVPYVFYWYGRKWWQFAPTRK